MSGSGSGGARKFCHQGLRVCCELTIVGLSEEVAKVKADGTCDLQVGDQVEIIPNHSCSTANNTGWYTCVRGDEIVDFIAVDARENSKKKGTL